MQNMLNTLSQVKKYKLNLQKEFVLRTKPQDSKLCIASGASPKEMIIPAVLTLFMRNPEEIKEGSKMLMPPSIRGTETPEVLRVYSENIGRIMKDPVPRAILIPAGTMKCQRSIIGYVDNKYHHCNINQLADLLKAKDPSFLEIIRKCHIIISDAISYCIEESLKSLVVNLDMPQPFTYLLQIFVDMIYANNEKEALALSKIWIYCTHEFPKEIVDRVAKPQLNQVNEFEVFALLLLLAGMQTSERLQGPAKEGEDKIVICGRCREKCGWIEKYEGTHMDYYSCEKCKKQYYGLRFCCKVHYYNVCYACSIVGQTRKTCGCFGSLKEVKHPGSLCINCIQPKDCGYECVKGCSFFICKDCAKVSSETDFFKRYKYDLKNMLGSGGFGAVYKCIDLVKKEDCALKKIDMNKMPPNQKATTLVEIDIMKQLHHPYIIEFKDSVYTDDNMLYIAMTLADGGDLSQIIDKNKNTKVFFEEKFILETAIKICNALKFLHNEKKIIHRDLKPQNILLTKNKQIKLADFGLAYDFNAHFEHLAKTMLGSPLYISPEILENKEYDFRTDIWSLGVILNEMATLSFTFNASSLPVIFEVIKSGKYREAGSKYSNGFRSLIKDMIVVNFTKRLNADQTLDRLNALYKGK